ncbi:MAG TPA: GNAT family N-acetyltransferase [Acidimicrobiales bacterium]|nr:GNAT family N-acetyltransferase [Acidimicrobiales bacterium]
MGELVDLASRVRAVDGYPVYLPEGGLRRFLTDPDPLAAWVAEDGGRIVGHVAANSQSHHAVMDLVRAAGIDHQVGVIARLLVDPVVRRQGIGAKLLDKARSHIVSLGLAPVLDVVVGSSPAVSLYRSAGWMEIGEVTFEVPGQKISELVFLAPS